jgi:NADH dehydrogenase
VKEVQADKILFDQKGEDGKIETKELPMGFCLWSTGVCKFEYNDAFITALTLDTKAQTNFAQTLAAKLPNEQTNKHALETDTHCRVLGTPLGDVYAIGDCATVQNNVSDHIVTFLRTLAWEKGKDPETLTVSFNDWRGIAKQVKKRFPQAADHLRRLDRLFAEYDKDNSGTLDFGELSELLKQIDSKLTSLPATAQRAHQQGAYLGKKFNKLAQAAPGMALNEMNFGDLDAAVYKAFEYKHLGSLAYVGNSALFDVQGTGVDVGGFKGFAGSLWAVYLWRSVYFAQSVSFRTRCLLAMDWTKRALFGRGKCPFLFVPLGTSMLINRRYDERSLDLISLYIHSLKGSDSSLANRNSYVMLSFNSLCYTGAGFTPISLLLLPVSLLLYLEVLPSPRTMFWMSQLIYQMPPT